MVVRTLLQLQKAVFLVNENVSHLIEGGFKFEPYDYGPFDSTVYSEAERLEIEGKAIIAPSAFGRWNTYAASEAGVAAGEELLRGLRADDKEYLQKVSDWVRSQSFSSLVKSIYSAYPKMRENSIFRG